jgi:hypothetical protein
MSLTPPDDARAPRTRCGVIDEARRRQRRHRRAGGSTAIAAVAFAIVIAGAAAGSGPGASPSESPATLAACFSRTTTELRGAPSRALLAIVGALRRPASRADVPPPPLRTPGNGGIYARYVRRVRIVGGVSYYLYAARRGACAGQPTRDVLAVLATHVPIGGAGRYGGVGGGGVDAAQLEAGRGLLLGPPGSSTSCTLMELIPDGVSAVRVRLPAGPASGFHPRSIVPAATITAPVERNLLVMRLPRSPGTALAHGATIDWLGGGRVLRVVRGG